MDKSLEKIQSLLPLGYLYLIILGIIKESLFYYQLNINILKYSSIMDVLISPIADLTSQPIIFISIVAMLGLAILFQYVLSKNSEKPWAQKMLGKKPGQTEFSKVEIQTKINQTFLVFFISGLSSFFFSDGIASASKLKKKIDNQTLTYLHKISFDSDKVEEVHLFDNNSAYYFYLSKGNKNVKIAPIGSIKNIELLDQHASK